MPNTTTTATSTTATSTAATATTAAASAASAASAAAPGKALRRTVRTLRILMALFFALASALPKLLALPSATTVFDAIGAGDWFMYLTGLVELSGAIGLLLPRLAGPAATALIAFLGCAFAVQLTAMHGENAGTPFLFMVPLAVIAWNRRAETAALLRPRPRPRPHR
ncbi:DoxX family protein [Kitasatospora sp. NPDC001540]|uniref:DoxX family protein n=1 Tax=Kitasatospora sp. NPDC001540 TaxID=3364014 RepID=UPI0036ACBA53